MIFMWILKLLYNLLRRVHSHENVFQTWTVEMFH